MGKKEQEEELKVNITCPMCGHKQEYEIVFEGFDEEDKENKEDD